MSMYTTLILYTVGTSLVGLVTSALYLQFVPEKTRMGLEIFAFPHILFVCLLAVCSFLLASAVLAGIGFWVLQSKLDIVSSKTLIVLTIVAALLSPLVIFISMKGITFYKNNFLAESPNVQIQENTPKEHQAYIIEDGKIFYDEYSFGQKAFAAVVTLGQSLGNTNMKKQELVSPDIDTFQILSPYYAKDKNTVYYKYQPLQNSDPTNFSILDSWYSHDGTNVWKGAILLFTNETEGALAAPTVHNENLISIGQQTYYVDQVSFTPLSEVVSTPVITFSGDWYHTNNAFWHKSVRVDIESDAESVIASNNLGNRINPSLLFFSGNDILLAQEDGTAGLLHQFASPVKKTWVKNGSAFDVLYLLAYLEDGTINSVVLKVQTQPVEVEVQSLGTSEAIPEINFPANLADFPIRINQALWTEDPDNKYLLLNRGLVSKQEGDYYFTEKAVFLRESVIVGADPKTFKLVQNAHEQTGNYIGVDRGMCFSFDSYVGDISPNSTSDSAEVGTESPVYSCSPTEDPISFYYDNLEYYFSPAGTVADQDEVGTAAAGSVRYLLGYMHISNVTNESQELSATLYQSLSMWESGPPPKSEIAFDKPITYPLSGTGYQIPPGAEIKWPVYVTAQPNVDGVGVSISLAHSQEKNSVIGTDSFERSSYVPFSNTQAQ